MRPFHVKSCAKINLTLEIGPKQADGYHTIHSVMAGVALYDHLFFKKKRTGFRLQTNMQPTGDQSENLIYKAFCAYQDTFGFDGGLDVRLVKQIPIGAGLGGGSGNCAAALKACARLSGLPDSRYHELIQVAGALGADVPFFMTGGCCIAGGIGDKLTPLPGLPGCYVVLVTPSFSFFTREMYQLLDSHRKQRHAEPAIGGATQAMAVAVRSGNLHKIAQYIYNDFELITREIKPEIDGICTILKSMGAYNAMLSGSGSTVFGLFGSQKKAKKAQAYCNTLNGARAVLVQC